MGGLKRETGTASSLHTPERGPVPAHIGPDGPNCPAPVPTTPLACSARSERWHENRGASADGITSPTFTNDDGGLIAGFRDYGAEAPGNQHCEGRWVARRTVIPFHVPLPWRIDPRDTVKTGAGRD